MYLSYFSTMDDQQAETIHEIERLRALADWYRNWALLAGSEQERTGRLGLADDIDAQARTLMRDIGKRSQSERR
jgi:hypothetical protein